ncbi:MAG: glycosyltransferase family 39 protein [Microthrixaceae bacterium]
MDPTQRPDPPATLADPERDAADAPIVDRFLLGLVGLALVAGVVLRFLPRSGLWLDEALSVNIASLPLGEIPDALRRDGHPPLFYVLLHFWQSLGGESDEWLRAMSGVVSLLTLPVMYLVGCRVGGRVGSGPGRLGVRRTGLIALAVTAVMPFGIRYAAETRMYALVVLFAAAGYLLVDDLLSARRSGRARVLVTVGTALLTAALLWTHYWSMWLLAAVGLLALWRAWRDPDPDRRVGARLLVAALVAGGILFLPWVSALLYQSAHTGTPWGEQFGPASVVVFTIVDFAGAKYGAAHLLTYLLVPLIALAAFARIQRAPRAAADPSDPDDPDASDAVRGIAAVGTGGAQQVVLTTRLAPRLRNELIVIAATLAIGWAAAAVSGNTFSSRYAAVVYPLFLVAIAAGIAVLRRPLGTSLVLAVVVVACAVGALGAARGDRSQNSEVAEAIVADAGQLDGPAVVVACPDQLGVSLQRELDQLDGSTSTGPLGDVVAYPAAGDPRFIDWVDYGDRNEAASPEQFLDLLDEQLTDDTTVYFVASPTYRTFDGQCEQLQGLLALERDMSEAVALDDSGIDEAAGLWIFRPRA